MKKYIGTILLIVLLVALLLFFIFGNVGELLGVSGTPEPSGSEAVAPAGLVINEIVSSNTYSLQASDGSSPDWVELYNGTSSAINLNGYGLTDDTVDRYKFEFPNVTIGPGEYLLLYATGQEDLSNSDGVLRMGFKLSATKGETLILSAPNDQDVHAIQFEAMPADVSYGRMADGTFAYFGLPTPGAENAGPTNSTPEFTEGVVESPLVINEYILENDYSIIDEDGDRSEWVEIKNTGTEPVSLKGYGLSDDEFDTKKWVFPDMELAPGEIRIVFLSGKDKTDPSGQLHANFGLGSGDTKLILSQEYGKSVDVAVLNHNMGSNTSCGRNPQNSEEWLYFPSPTPGAENTTKGFTEIEESTEKYLPDLHISETKTSAGVGEEASADWIELANTGDTAINLEGYGLSDDKDEPFLFKFPSTEIEPGQYLLIYCGDMAEGDLSTTAFGLASRTDTIYLSQPDGVVIDHIQTGVQYPGITSGRETGSGSSKRVFFREPTPGAANSANIYQGYSAKPTFSQVGGYVENGTTIEITAANGAAIYYTTDGSKPTTNSTAYHGPITISKTMPLRAIAVESGKLTSEVTTENYLVTEQHDIPVVCISSDPDGLFGYENGILADGPGHTHNEADFPYQGANFWKDWEREISFEWFEADGTKGVEFPAGIKVFGQYSRADPQKSMAIYLRGSYGQSSVTYPFFRDYDVTTFENLILRTSGQDWNVTKLRDAFFSQSVKDTMDLDYMEYRPCAVYINGEYWGLYNLREKQNENYIVHHYPGTVKGQLDVIKADNNAQAGTNEDIKDLREYISSHDLSDPEVYEEVCKRVDADEFIDYIIVETFYNNTDTGNIRLWRDRNGGKYRWMLFDMDWGLSPSTYQWNTIEEFFNPNGHGVGDNFSSTIQCGLLENDEWREKFIERYAYHLNNTFAPERLRTLLDAMAAEIRTEMPRHIERWEQPSSMERWESNVERLANMAEEKVEITKQDLKEFFNLSDSRMQELFPNG